MNEKDVTYYVYMVTNYTRTTLYTGVTNNLASRLIEHWSNRGDRKTFAGRYNCFYLVYFEKFQFIEAAIERESEIKKWNRKKKEALIVKTNPNWMFLNAKVCGSWPPNNITKRF